MNITTIAATLGAALILAGSPVLASAADSQAPIKLDQVEISQSLGALDDFSPGLVTIAFTNENQAPATDIVFALESNGKVIDHIEDVGTYANGTTYRHSFPDLENNGDQQIAVERVTFADGSVWSNDNLSYATTPYSPVPDAAAFEMDS